MNSLISKLSNKVKDPTLLLGAMSAFFVKVLAAGGAFLLNVVIARNLGAAVVMAVVIINQILLSADQVNKLLGFNNLKIFSR
ncbi:hypothetical protein [Vibrio cyclitrophicus]|uniref:hypothetical protein n=1 Tax=Vibrio cyclitrophicus TaxID=47951 RepID=UPI0002DD8824|nr:hypothetical protein [Vibrio cyclitrophicus]OED65384.1 hypothetical protein OAU_16300 [Vibrio cyclitrophicus ZF99]PME10665.1 hypothetical protein BCV43_03460 [Vibrio cyclitrophicus]PME40635.1 hypothetical protein BCV36_19925 [Vibrio cyclitrophicus]PME56089.1 hypothetical protein BCV37_22485 [Vibrio cyclitrophicus]PMF38917.1 hypothetical protein BCV15_19670 [Vibrio cyclitrophicus]